jgi:hypothetical protein
MKPLPQQEPLRDNLDLSHLHKALHQIAMASDEERLAYIRKDQYVEYSVSREGVEKLEALFSAPDALSPEGLILIGESQMGKSAIIEELLKNHPANDNPNGDAAIVQVLKIQFPDSGGNGIYGAICSKLNVTLPTTAKIDHYRDNALEIMDRIDVRVLVVDELANALTLKAPGQSQAMNQIKYIMNARRRPVVLSATKKAYNLIKADDQIRNRFTVHLLPNLAYGEDYQEFLMGWECLLPLRRPSNLGNAKLGKKICAMAGGHIGNTVKLLRSAASEAIKSGKESIAEIDLKSISWKRQSDVDAEIGNL